MHHGSLETVRAVCFDVAGNAGHDALQVLEDFGRAVQGDPSLVDLLHQFETLLES